MRPLTDADAKAPASLRPFLAPHKGEGGDIAAGRAAFDAIMQRVPAPQNIGFATDIIGGVSGIWCRPPNPTNRALFTCTAAGSSRARRMRIATSSARSRRERTLPPLSPTTDWPRSILSRPRSRTYSPRTRASSNADSEMSSLRAIPPAARSHSNYWRASCAIPNRCSRKVRYCCRPSPICRCLP